MPALKRSNPGQTPHGQADWEQRSLCRCSHPHRSKRLASWQVMRYFSTEPRSRPSRPSSIAARPTSARTPTGRTSVLGHHGRAPSRHPSGSIAGPGTEPFSAITAELHRGHLEGVCPGCGEPPFSAITAELHRGRTPLRLSSLPMYARSRPSRPSSIAATATPAARPRTAPAVLGHHGRAPSRLQLCDRCGS